MPVHPMQDKFGQVLVPVEEVIEMKNGQKSISERKFFPSSPTHSPMTPRPSGPGSTLATDGGRSLTVSVAPAVSQRPSA